MTPLSPSIQPATPLSHSIQPATSLLPPPLHPPPERIRTAGKHSGQARALACGGVQLAIEWGDPFGGSGVDEFTLKGADELHVNSKLGLKGGDGGGFYAVYKRKR